MYKRLLVATNLLDESNKLLDRAQGLAELFKAKLMLVHIVEYTPMMYGGGEFAIPLDTGVEEKLKVEAQEKLAAQAKKYNIAPADQHLELGATKERVIQLAEKVGADLILVGTHDQHGLLLLFGSTAGALLRSTPCDILAIRVDE